MANLTSIASSTFIALLLTSGCGGSASNSGTPNVPVSGPAPLSAADSIYVTQDDAAFLPAGPSSILQYSRSANGSVSPASTVMGPAGIIFGALVVDQAGNLVVGGRLPGCNGSEIMVYGPGASGTATPTRTITGSATGLQSVCGQPLAALDVDSAGNVYANDTVTIGSGPTGRSYSGIEVFSATASGNVAPIRTIGGPATTFADPGQIAVDAAGTLYVVNLDNATPGNSSILMFNSSLTGNVAPDNGLSGPKTTIYIPQGVSVDQTGNIYVASLAPPSPGATPLSGTASILEFSAASTGNVAPIRTISGPATTMGEIGFLRVDSQGNIYVLNGSNILKFAPAATGNAAPSGTITPMSFQSGGGIAVQ